MRLDGAVADVEALADRLSGFRLSDEVVLYIGLAGQPLRTRVRQYYRTRTRCSESARRRLVAEDAEQPR